VISHTDLDAPCASVLADRRVAAVVNAQRSISGRFPHPGPSLLLKAGIPLIDQAGEAVLHRIEEGHLIEIDGGDIYSSGDLVGTGVVMTAAELRRQLEDAKSNVAGELTRFVENTMSYVKEEQSLLYESCPLPDLRTKIRGRHCLIIVRGAGARGDLRAIRSYIAAVKPVLIGVDGGADLLLQERYRPDIVIGDMDSISDAALHCGSELIVHAYPDGQAPGRERLERLDLPFVVVRSRGTSEDVAMLLAHEEESELIAAVGTHLSLDEFLEKGRGGMSSTFLARLRVGSILVDAKGISRLYPSGPSRRLFFYMAAVAGLIIVVLLAAAPEIRATLDLWLLRLIAFFSSLQS
jgi:uncharacterized membrane-anchored protein